MLKIEIKKNSVKAVVLLLFAIGIAGIFPSSVYAATLSLVPNLNSISVGNIFQTSIVVNTQGKVINNSDGLIQFPVDLLEVVSVSKNSSVFSLWVEEPTFSNYTGKITYNGGVPNPGFIGANGAIATITFRAKKAGSATIIFSDAAVRENDGLGTDILSFKSNSVVTIGKLQQTEIPEADSVKSTVPSKPIVVSDTHPNQDLWYANNDASFGWKVPSGVTSIQATLNKSQNSIPNITYDNSVSQKTLSNLSDGISYFHIRFANSEGFGPIEHYKIQVDSIAPSSFTPVILDEDYRNFVTLDAKDVTSGIAYYTIKIDKGSIIKVKNSDIVDEKYELPLQVGGEHTITVTAYDRAQNHTEASVSFVSPSINAPIISFKTEEVKQDEMLTINGKIQYPGEDVEIFVESEGREPAIYKKKTSIDGSFSIVTDPIKYSGPLSAWGQVSLSDTVKGEKSDKIYLSIRKLGTSEEVVKIIPILIVILPALSILILILFVIYLGWHKFFGLKRKINREAEEILSDVHKSMAILKDELAKRLRSLEKIKIDTKLNKKEQEISRDLEDMIDDIDTFIEKKIKKTKI